MENNMVSPCYVYREIIIRFKLTSSNGIMEIYINAIGYNGLKCAFNCVL